MESAAIPSRPGRIGIIDLARGLALVAMAVYHFTWDLEFFGYVERGLTAQGGWKLFARGIASSFLFLVGVSLALGHGERIRWRGFWRRWAMVAGAAALISLVTFQAMPADFIFFGILHQIALASLLGLAFLRLPPALTFAAALFFIAAPFFLRGEAFNHAALWWIGLSSPNPRSNDYVPLFPWFGVVLLGIAATRVARRRGLVARLGAESLPRAAAPLALPGRHSLLIYLVHQPVLIGLVWLASQLAPPLTETPQVGFLQLCAANCEAVRDADFCSRYCACLLDSVEQRGMLGAVMGGTVDDGTQSGIEAAGRLCTGGIEPGL